MEVQSVSKLVAPERTGDLDTLSPSCWRKLTTDGKKCALYRGESYFRESWHDVADVLRDRAFGILQRHAVIIFKPEAVLGRRLLPGLALLRRHGFVPVLSRLVRLDRLASREMWRYQWDAATLDRLAVCERLTSATQALWVVLRDVSTNRQLPAGVRLASLKGSPHPHERRITDLRSELKSPNRMITFLHVADEPADTVREMGILFGSEERRGILSELEQYERSHGLVARDDVEAAARGLAARHPESDLDAGRALRELERTIERARATAPSAALETLAACIYDIHVRQPLKWESFARALPDARLDVPEWDAILIGAAHIRHDEDHPCTIEGDVGISGWRDLRGDFVTEP